MSPRAFVCAAVLVSLALPASVGPHAQTVGTPYFRIQVGRDAGTATPTPPPTVPNDAPFSVSVSGPLDGVVNRSFAVSPAASGASPSNWENLDPGSMPQGLAFDGSNGRISGVPTAPGMSAPMRVRATAPDGRVATSPPFRIAVSPSDVTGLTVTVLGPFVATKDEAFEAKTVSTGGTDPKVYGLASGTLPAGLLVDPNDGAIKGAPTQSGAFPNLSVVVWDAAGRIKTSSTFAIAVVDPQVYTLSVVVPGPFSGASGDFYALRPSARNAVGATTWSVASGELPAGLRMDATTGVVSGHPAAPGTSGPLVVGVADSKGSSAYSDPFSIVISDVSPLGVGLSGSPSGEVGTPFLFHGTASGGAKPYDWEILPVGTDLASTGLTFSRADGLITGTPTQARTFAGVRFRATDASGATKVTESFDLTVSPRRTVRVSGGSLATRVGRQASSTSPTATGGRAPYAWSAAGPVPAGLSLDPATGVLSGTPTQQGSVDVRLRVVDADGGEGVGSSHVAVQGALRASYGTPQNYLLGAFRATKAYAENALGTVTWSIAEGGPPPGLSLSSATGELSGVATVAGNYQGLRIKATDVDGSTAVTEPLTIFVTREGEFTIARYPERIGGRVGRTFRVPGVQTNGGVGRITYSFRKVPGDAYRTPPEDWVLDATNGSFSGTWPSGDREIVVRATDEIGQVATAYGIYNSNWGQLRIGDARETVCYVGKGCTTPLVSTWAYSGYTNLIGTPRMELLQASPEIARDLTFNAEYGSLAGTPTTEGTWTYRLRMTDQADGATVETGTWSIRVKAASPARARMVGRVGVTTRTRFCDLPPEGLKWDRSSNLVHGTYPLDGDPCVLTMDYYSWNPAREPGYYPGGKYRVLDASDNVVFSVDYDAEILPPLVALTQAPNVCTRINTPFAMRPPTFGGITGTPSYAALDRWSDQPYSFPEGVSFDPATGAVSGRSAVAVSPGGFYVRVTDSFDGATADSRSSPVSSNQYIVVRDPLDVAFDGVRDNQPATVQAETGPWFWRYPRKYGLWDTPNRITMTGTLPSGLVMNPDGSITGTTYDAPGSYPISLTLWDGCDDASVTQQVNIVLSPRSYVDVKSPIYLRQNVQVTTSPAPVIHFPRDPVEDPYWFKPDSWQADDPSKLPAGMTVVPETGQLRGAPTTPGVYPGITVRFTTKHGWPDVRAVPFDVIVDPGPHLRVPDANLLTGVAAEIVPETANATSPARFTLSGALPDGMSMDQATGRISGAPARTGTASQLVMTMADAGGSSVSSEPFTIRVAASTAPTDRTVNWTWTAAMQCVTTCNEANLCASRQYQACAGGGCPAPQRSCYIVYDKSKWETPASVGTPAGPNECLGEQYPGTYWCD